ncbi:MAG: DNA repair protein RecO, partial [Candidatus Nomurabacteria bacterium]|nr:DNA repair protein RecO [Candidatus Nomurabacteria bacterium]
MSQNLRTKAIVLRRTNYGEADRILSVITPDNGRLSVMARSVRKEKSRLAGGIELFAICDIVLHLGKGEIATLTGAKLNKFFAQIITDYHRLQFGYEALKQIARASETIDEPDFYTLLEDCLGALDNLKIDLMITQTWFYLRLADLLGDGLNTVTDASGMKLVEDAHYNFDSADRVFIFSENGRYDARHIKLLRVMIANQPDVVGKIAGVDEIIDDCLRLAQIVA